MRRVGQLLLVGHADVGVAQVLRGVGPGARVGAQRGGEGTTCCPMRVLNNHAPLQPPVPASLPRRHPTLCCSSGHRHLLSVCPDSRSSPGAAHSSAASWLREGGGQGR